VSRKEVSVEGGGKFIKAEGDVSKKQNHRRLEMKPNKLLPLVVFLVVFGLACNVPLGMAASELVSLKAISFLPPMAAKSKIFKEFLSRVEANSKGGLKLNYLGGPEVVDSLEQGEAVKRGVVDIAFVPGAMYMGLVPEAFLLCLSRVTAEEELAKGVIDALQPSYAKAGLYFWGELFGSNEGTFLIWTNKGVKRPQEFAGQRWGAGAPLFNAFTKAFGADMIVMPASESYTAIERGMVDGWLYPAGSAIPLGLHERIKHYVDHPFWGDYAGVIVNLSKWNSLPKHMQKVMQDTLRETAPEFGRRNTQAELDYLKVARNAGVKPIKFSPDDAKWFLDTIYNSTWKWRLESLPITGPKVKQIIDP